MNLHEMVFGQWPAIAAIYEMGFLPEDNEIQEIPPEMYAACEKQGFDISKRLYTIVPLYGDHQQPDNTVSLLTEDEVAVFKKAANFLRKYAKDANCNSEASNDILAAAATRLPSVFTEKSKFARK